MNFKEWLSDNGELFWESLDPNKMDVSNVHLEPENIEFDEDDARRDCEREHRYWDDSDYYNDIYDDWRDDPNFEAPITVDDWEEDNPEPESEDFENEEEYEDALQTWRQERDKVESAHDDAVSDWESEMRSKRSQAEEAADNARQESIDNCIDEKRDNHTDQHTGFKHEFEFDGEKYEVGLDKSSHSYMGRNYDDMYTVMFHGPRGYSTTGMAGGKATAIYAKLIAAIKKLVDTQDVDGLMFTPAEPAMRIMYERFYQSFLKKQFVRVEPNVYLRRDLVKDLANDESKRTTMYNKAKYAYQNNKQQIQAAETLKSIRRGAVRLGKDIVGKFVPLYGGMKPAFIVEFEPSTARFTFMMVNAFGPQQRTVEFYNVALPFNKMTKENTAGDMIEFNSNLNYDDHELFPVLAPEFGQYMRIRPDKPNIPNYVEAVKEQLLNFEPLLTIQFKQGVNFLDDLKTQHPVAAEKFLELFRKFGLSVPQPEPPKPEPPKFISPVQQPGQLPSGMAQRVISSPEVQPGEAGVPAINTQKRPQPV